MGLTHDFRGVAGIRNRNRRAQRRVVAVQRMGRYRPDRFGMLTEPGIPHLLRRRARWFGARLRHPRG
ncbi:MAG: hypothetical protein ACRDP3_08680 [Streptomyces sp.]|uniref:hypothetical protein n=1 Tax=Streptomyces sp. TaxID=1931 RepID=UPI003D6C69EF